MAPLYARMVVLANEGAAERRLTKQNAGQQCGW
jgi:hypothetical protein